jgi:HD superfamily phosphohydrolase
MRAHEVPFVVDSLYGYRTLDAFLRGLVSTPEVQRLRDVRLSNINSMSLTGAANVSRFEHSIGVALLAERAGEHLELPLLERRQLIAAAMLHDVGITPFGHLMEEAFRIAGKCFDHERRLAQVFAGQAEVGNVNFQIFRGRMIESRPLLSQRKFSLPGLTIESIFNAIQGKGLVGRLVNGTLDLDNIDNVCRMAVHVGIPVRRALPEELVQAMVIRSGERCIWERSLHLVDEWLDARYRLYSLLMTNPVDFSAKAMLIEAMRLGICGDEGQPPALAESDWTLTDAEVLRRLAGYPPSRELIQRLELGQVYPLLGYVWVRGSPEDRAKGIVLQDLRSDIAAKLRERAADVLIYTIRDKRVRKVPLQVISESREGDRQRDIVRGEMSEKNLVGVVARLRSAAESKARTVALTALADMYGSQLVEECDPLVHVKVAFEAAGGTGHPKDGRLF